MNKLRIRLPIQFERHHSSTHFWSISGLFSPFSIFSVLAQSLMGSMTVLKLDIMVHIMDKGFTDYFIAVLIHPLNPSTRPGMFWECTSRFKLSDNMSECQGISVRMWIGLVQKLLYCTSKIKAFIQYYFNQGHIRGQMPVKSCTLEITIWSENWKCQFWKYKKSVNLTHFFAIKINIYIFWNFRSGGNSIGRGNFKFFQYFVRGARLWSKWEGFLRWG